jgi:hypothetical protein
MSAVDLAKTHPGRRREAAHRRVFRHNEKEVRCNPVYKAAVPISSSCNGKETSIVNRTYSSARSHEASASLATGKPWERDNQEESDRRLRPRNVRQIPCRNNGRRYKKGGGQPRNPHRAFLGNNGGRVQASSHN